MSSKACLDFQKGMHIDCITSSEFELEGEWYRCEIHRKKDGSLMYTGYQRLGAYWKPITHSDQPTNSPAMVDSIGLHLLVQARHDIDRELKLKEGEAFLKNSETGIKPGTPGYWTQR